MAGRYRSSTIAKAQSSLEILMSMGFPRKRAEKALVATGDIGVQEASEWILSHVFDPELDQPGGRDFVVYALPLGGLGSQLQELWDTSLAQTGRNGAHKSFPHVTLCQFFKVSLALRVNASLLVVDRLRSV
jgi:ubiquitin-associated SH3 domain-containing protein